MSSTSQGSAGSSRLAKPVRQSQRASADVKGKNKATTSLVDDGDDSLWVDKYEPTSEVRRVLVFVNATLYSSSRLHGHAELKQ